MGVKYLTTFVIENRGGRNLQLRNTLLVIDGASLSYWLRLQVFASR